MTTNTIAQLTDPHGFSPDPLTDLFRSGAQRLIEQAVEAEFAVLLEAYTSDKTDDGRAPLVRHGHLPERKVMTGIGAGPVKVSRVRDRGDDAEKVRFTSTILPPYLRKAKSIEELLPWLYLKGIPPVTFAKRSPPCLGPIPQGCPRPRYRASKPIGGMSTAPTARPERGSLRLHLGGRLLFSTPNGRGKTKRSGADRSGRVGPQRDHRFGRRLS